MLSSTFFIEVILSIQHGFLLGNLFISGSSYRLDLFSLIELIYKMKEIILSLINIIARKVFIKLFLLLLLYFLAILRYLCLEVSIIFLEMSKIFIFIRNKKYFAIIISFGQFLTLLDYSLHILIMVLCKNLCLNMKSWKHGLLFFGFYFFFLFSFWFQFSYLYSMFIMF